MATNLPNVFAFCFGGFAEGLKVNHSRTINKKLNLVFTGDLITQRFKLLFARPTENGSPVRKLCRNRQARIFVGQSAQGARQLFAAGVHRGANRN